MRLHILYKNFRLMSFLSFRQICKYQSGFHVYGCEICDKIVLCQLVKWLRRTCTQNKSFTKLSVECDQQTNDVKDFHRSVVMDGLSILIVRTLKQLDDN